MTDDDASVSSNGLASGTGRAHDATVQAEISRAGSELSVVHDGLRVRQSIRRGLKDAAAHASIGRRPARLADHLLDLR